MREACSARTPLLDHCRISFKVIPHLISLSTSRRPSPTPNKDNKLTGGLDSSVMASLFFSYFSRTILSAWMAVSRMVRYFLASSRMGLVSVCEGVRLHLSLNCSRSCLSDFSSSSSDCRLWDRAGRVSQHKWLKLYCCSTTSLRDLLKPQLSQLSWTTWTCTVSPVKVNVSFFFFFFPVTLRDVK